MKNPIKNERQQPLLVKQDIQHENNQKIVQQYIKAGRESTENMRSEESSLAGQSKTLAIKRLTREEEYAIFSHIDELTSRLQNDLYALGILTELCVERANKLIRNQEGFDLAVHKTKIKSREHYMKGIPILCVEMKQIHADCEEILFGNSDLSEFETAEMRKCLEGNMEKRRNIMLRFYFNEHVMNEFYEYVKDYHWKYTACQRKCRKSPDEPTLGDELARFERNSWLTPEDWNTQFGAISKAKNELKWLRDVLKISCLSKVEACVKSHAAMGLEHDELLAEGMQGIENAVMTFKYQGGARLSSHANSCIRDALTTAIKKKAQAMRIPPSVLESVSKIVLVKRQLEMEYGRDPSADEVAMEISMPVERIQVLLDYINENMDMLDIGESTVSIISLNSGTHRAEIQSVPDPSAVSPMDIVGFPMLKAKIKDVLDTLTEREREVLEQRFGLKNGLNRTLEEVGRRFQVTRERIRQIEAKASRKSGTAEDPMPESGTTP